MRANLFLTAFDLWRIIVKHNCLRDTFPRKNMKFLRNKDKKHRLRTFILNTKIQNKIFEKKMVEAIQKL